MPTRVCSQCALSQERLPSQMNVMLRSVRCDETSLAGRKRLSPALHHTALRGARAEPGSVCPCYNVSLAASFVSYRVG